MVSLNSAEISDYFRCRAFDLKMHRRSPRSRTGFYFAVRTRLEEENNCHWSPPFISLQTPRSIRNHACSGKRNRSPRSRNCPTNAHQSRGRDNALFTVSWCFGDSRCRTYYFSEVRAPSFDKRRGRVFLLELFRSRLGLIIRWRFVFLSTTDEKTQGRMRMNIIS